MLVINSIIKKLKHKPIPQWKRERVIDAWIRGVKDPEWYEVYCGVTPQQKERIILEYKAHSQFEKWYPKWSENNKGRA